MPTPDQERQLLSFLKKSRQQFYNSLMAQKKENDRRYKKTLEFAWKWYQRYQALDKSVKSEVDREQKARLEISKVLGRMKHAKSDEEWNRLRKEIERRAAIQFDAQQKITKYKLDQMANQLRRLRKELSDRYGDRRKIVAQRVAEWLKGFKKPPKKDSGKKKR